MAGFKRPPKSAEEFIEEAGTHTRQSLAPQESKTKNTTTDGVYLGEGKEKTSAILFKLTPENKDRLNSILERSRYKSQQQMLERIIFGAIVKMEKGDWPEGE